MKLKGIWVAIAVICVAGIGVTNYSVRHLAAGGNEYVSELSEGSNESETTTIAEEAVAQAQGVQEAQEKAQVLSGAVQAESLLFALESITTAYGLLRGTDMELSMGEGEVTLGVNYNVSLYQTKAEADIMSKLELQGEIFGKTSDFA